MKKVIISLFAILICLPALAGGGDSGDSCTSHEGTEESEIWRAAYGGATGCNCDRNADKYVATGEILFGTDYPAVGECLADQGGKWKFTEGMCEKNMPNQTPDGLTARHAAVGNCWELWCAAANTYVMGVMDATGARDESTISYNGGCKPCPVGEVLKTTFGTNEIEFAVVSKTGN
ncbi:MAG: hypothetical protein LBL46_02085 [Rickettsiales bacterium]|jgi:hypothetical protein|nr:hypothetical protein [Rickettsiales bacterium]